jgi:hypothetical protein
MCERLRPGCTAYQRDGFVYALRLADALPNRQLQVLALERAVDVLQCRCNDTTPISRTTILSLAGSRSREYNISCWKQGALSQPIRYMGGPCVGRSG